jgi:hypothetical protein
MTICGGIGRASADFSVDARRSHGSSDRCASRGVRTAVPFLTQLDSRACGALRGMH